MAETSFPGQHTTTTTVTSNTTVQTNIRFDPSYVRSIPGILKVVQVALIAMDVALAIMLPDGTFPVAAMAARRYDGRSTPVATKPSLANNHKPFPVFSLLGFICIQFSHFNNASKGLFFSWISMIAFWFTGILLGFYLFHIVEKFYKIPWLKIELLFTALWTFLYLLAAVLAVTVHDNPHAAAAFFGFSCTLAYCVDAYLKWRAARAGGLAQGTRVVSKQTTVTREGY
ncbi:putative chemokine factor superfamily 4 [Danaus plexippus plexippus]|uniref:Chemokine factor superfamily 4 n=1 Tax=Danaus plexippus plexippus TaxID=278856 RepID=A0A212F7X3_DANPL|nr:putative chemokine factor superfamily 4 [Danaus plexippus plexippus]